MLSRDAIYEAFYDDDTARGFLHSHSYTGNPLACRAALATLDLFASDDVLAANARKSARLAAALAPLGARDDIRHLRQRGTIFAFDVALAPEQALERELLLRPIGTSVYLMPPYVLDDGELDLLAAQTLATLDATLAEVRA
ncbi:MAG: Adenosylmethionine-8-amino-7-oxononanoate aminotransferase [Burkholderia gladioli]|nr:MAG: Adenosylmethionine-8-amino-7-oxononanoate aminotransferase [Burkholderia gladioli]